MAKILFLSANTPMGDGYLKTDKEYRTIDEKLRAATYRDRLELVSAWAVRPLDLLDQLNLHHPDIVHFSGHGNAKGDLMLVGADELARPISLQDLKTVFQAVESNTRLVILNTCYSRQQAEELTKVIDCVIAMKDSIYDDAAIAFTGAFYQALGYGRSIQNAFAQGLAALPIEGIEGADIPELIVRSGVNATKIVLTDLVQPSVHPGVKGAKIVPTDPAQQQAQTIPTLFYVHAPEDIDFCVELDKQFSVMKRNGLLRSFYEHDLLGGDDIQKIVQKELQAAKIILLIVTPNLLRSQEIDEQQLTLAWKLYQSGTRVIPIKVRPTMDWDLTPFKGLSALPRDGKPVYAPKKREEEFYNIAMEIRHVLDDELKKQNN